MAKDNLAELIRSSYPSQMEQTLIDGSDGRRYSYRDLDQASAKMARLLSQLGVAGGDRVLVQVDKSAQALFLYVACLRVGAIYVPLNPAYRRAEMGHFLSDSEPRVFVCPPEAEGEARELSSAHGVAHVLTLGADGKGSLMVRSQGLDSDPDFGCSEVDADQVAALVYTSGTTGRSKGAMLTHGNLISNGLALRDAWRFVSTDVLLHALPLFHVHGLFVACHPVLLAGASMIFLPRLEIDAVLDLLPRATVVMGVPTYYTRLLGDPRLDRDLCRSVRLFTSGSAPLRQETFHAFEARTGHQILERYGMTEAGMITSNPFAGPRRPGTVGPPLPGVETRVVDDDGQPIATGDTGRLEARSPGVMAGYFRQPQKTAETFRADGFLMTGDLARQDEDGFITLVGRATDLVISGGLNVYPKQVELVLDAMDLVAESAVFGVPHPDFGEAVVAVVVPRTRAGAGEESLSEEAVVAALKGELAPYKIPKRVFFVLDLPRNAMGKVEKAVLKERHQATFSGS